MFLSIEQIPTDRFVAIQDDGVSLKYGELTKFSKEISKIVLSRSLVFSFCQNDIGALAGYVAFLNGHIVPILLNVQLDFELLKYLLETYQPDYLWVPTKRKKDLCGEFV